MTRGTKSLLFGCHQFLLHPAFVLLAWVRRYGLPGPKMLLAIIVHDWGYWGCEHMDRGAGERHPAPVATWFWRRGWGPEGYEVACHSRFYAMGMGRKPSRLAWADKVGTAMYPPWLWVLLARMSGELAEYMGDAKYEINQEHEDQPTPLEFFARYRAKVAGWVQRGSMAPRVKA